MKKLLRAGRATRRGRLVRTRTAARKIPREAADFRVPPSLATPKQVFLCCRSCGYDPPVVPKNGTCPKCGGHSWERYALSARLLPKKRI